MSDTIELVETTVTAETAPLGVQLWPTISPEFADNFTLYSVAVIRTEAREYVLWVYRDGSQRTFDLGEQIAARVPATRV
jgi:hypothetical protein